MKCAKHEINLFESPVVIVGSGTYAVYFHCVYASDFVALAINLHGPQYGELVSPLNYST